MAKRKKWIRKHKGLAAVGAVVGILLVSYLVYGGITGNWLLWWAPTEETPVTGDTSILGISGTLPLLSPGERSRKARK